MRLQCLQGQGTCHIHTSGRRDLEMRWTKGPGLCVEGLGARASVCVPAWVLTVEELALPVVGVAMSRCCVRSGEVEPSRWPGWHKQLRVWSLLGPALPPSR